LDVVAELGRLLAAPTHLPLLAVVGWVVRVPLVSREEGHEAITRAAWEGLALTDERKRALISGVRAPDVSVVGLLTSALPFAQRRHALRAWSGSTTADGIHAVRDFMTSRHLRALALPEGARRWSMLGEVLHCLQDSYSPAHVDRSGTRIARMKHWGPIDHPRRSLSGGRGADEHRFPTDPRDIAFHGGALSTEARAAAAASRRYLELAARHSAADHPEELRSVELAMFLDDCFGRDSRET
jgi:hypothetical protein